MTAFAQILTAADGSFWHPTIERLEKVWEIRVKRDMPVILQTSYGEMFLDDKGDWTPRAEQAGCYGRERFGHLTEVLCKDSVYAFEPQLSQGYVTLEGGYRVGVAGWLRHDARGELHGMKQIESFNIRISHSVEYDISAILRSLEEVETIPNILLISAPGEGKTTCLRSLIRALSNGTGKHSGVRVGVVDERGELNLATWNAEEPNANMQNARETKLVTDLGLRTDVVTNCRKAYGMQMLIRSMNPRVIAVDEIGRKEDFTALQEASRCGVAVLATMHAGSLENVQRRLGEWDENLENCFGLVFLLSSHWEDRIAGRERQFTIKEVYRSASIGGSLVHYGGGFGNRDFSGKRAKTEDLFSGANGENRLRV